MVDGDYLAAVRLKNTGKPAVPSIFNLKIANASRQPIKSDASF
jgi:hypothetical protein